MVAFRSVNIGNDTYNYYIAYNSISQSDLFGDINSRYEIGYLFINYLIAKIGFTYNFFQVIVTIFIYFGISKFIYRYSNNYSLSIYSLITLQFMGSTMNITRQWIALVIVIYSIDYILERKFSKFFILILIASTFHYSAIIFIFSYFIVNIKWNKRKIILSIICIFTVFFLFNKIVLLITNMTGRYSDYLDSTYFNLKDNIAVYVQFFISLAFFIAVSNINYSNNKIKLKNEKNECEKITIYDLSYKCLCLYVITSFWGINSAIMSRLNIYYAIFLIIIIPNLISSYSKKKYGIIMNFFILFCMLISFYIILKYRPEWNYIYPYSFF